MIFETPQVLEFLIITENNHDKVVKGEQFYFDPIIGLDK